MLDWLKSRKLRKTEPLRDMSLQSEHGSGAKAAGHIGNRRQSCFWEPIYSPDHLVALAPYDWDFNRDAGPSRRFVSGTTLEGKVIPGETFKVVNVTFRDCDFQGDFRPYSLLLFDECNFTGCDFAYSSWKGVSFRKCTFSDSSISLAEFDGCEFRDCTWERVGFGSKTEFKHCFLNNPYEFNLSSISNRNPKDDSVKHRMNQWYRLRGTRAHVLRTLMISHQTTGDEHTYYEIVKLHELQCSIARMTEKIFGIIFVKGKRFKSILGLFFDFSDYIILRTLGFLNNWGVSASRSCFALAACWAVFGLLYQYLDFGVDVARPFQKSFDITLLIGYGNQVSADPALSTIQNIHAISGIVIYTVFFATVVSKLSRAR